jgi:dUTP pyrophosphatase
MSSYLVLRIKPSDKARLLYVQHSQAHKGDSGLDLYCIQDQNVLQEETATINFGIQCEMLQVFEATSESKESFKNVSYYLYPRSSISNTPLRLANSVGIIDAGYSGQLMAKVDNIKPFSYMITSGQRLFQICSGTLEPFRVEIVESLHNETSTRGSGGFGSTTFSKNAIA